MPKSKNIAPYLRIENKILSMILTTTLILLCLIPPCIAKDSSIKQRNRDNVKIGLMIESGKDHEKCLKLTPGKVLNYSFEASRPMDFNIHYHNKEEVLYPVPQKSVSIIKSFYNPESEEVYCMMWSNTTAQSISLTYRFEVTEK